MLYKIFFLLILIPSSILGDQYSVFDIIKGEERNSAGELVADFYCTHNEDGLVDVFVQNVYTPEKIIYSSEYEYDENYRLVKMMNYENDVEVSRLYMEYNHEDDSISMIYEDKRKKRTETVFLYEEGLLSGVKRVVSGKVLDQFAVEVVFEEDDVIIKYFSDGKELRSDRFREVDGLILFQESSLEERCQKVTYLYEDGELKERRAEDSIITFEVIEIHSRVNQHYSSFKSFTNLRNYRIDEWWRGYKKTH